jgi:hypothetical protein
MYFVILTNIFKEKTNVRKNYHFLEKRHDSQINGKNMFLNDAQTCWQCF